MSIIMEIIDSKCHQSSSLQFPSTPKTIITNKIEETTNFNGKRCEIIFIIGMVILVNILWIMNLFEESKHKTSSMASQVM